MALLVESPGCLPTGIGWACDRRLDDGSRMSGDVHVRFCERLRGRFPRATHPVLAFTDRYNAERVLRAPKRYAKYGLAVHEEKTRMLPFFHREKKEQGSAGRVCRFWDSRTTGGVRERGSGS